MAWSAVTSRGTAESNTSGTTIAMSPSAAIAVDKIALVWCSADNVATADGASSNHSISDTDGHTWTKLKEWTRSAGAAADGITISLYATRVTAEIGTADTITITFTSAIVEKVMGVGEATVAAGQTFELAAGSDVGAQGTSSTPSVTNSGLASQEHLFIGLMGRETSSAITDDADFTLLNTDPNSGGANPVGGICETRIATSTGDTYNPTLAASRDWAAVIVALDEIAAGGADVTLDAVLAGVGTVVAPVAIDLALAAAPAGVGAVAAAVSVDRGLFAALAGSGTVTAGLDRDLGLLAALAGVGTVAADLTVTTAAEVALAASLAGVGTVVVVMAVERALAAVVAGVGEVVADLDVVQRTEMRIRRIHSYKDRLYPHMGWTP